MQIRRKTAIAALVGTSMIFLASCEKEQEQEVQRVHMGVAYYDQRDTFLNEMIGEMKNRMKEYETEDEHEKHVRLISYKEIPFEVNP